MAHDTRESIAIDSTAARDSPGRDLVDVARAFLATLPSAAVHAFLADWPTSRTRRRAPPEVLPALRALDCLAGRRAQGADALLERLRADARTLAWRQTYPLEVLGSEFMDNYAWTELVGPRGLADSERLACGTLILGPRTHYPSHRHEAYELYVPLSGTASWRQGDGKWQEHPPGSVLEHATEVPHAMRTAEEPLVALYLWRSHDLAQSARLEPR